MKKIIIVVSGLFFLYLSLLVFKTFTVNKVCGWNRYTKNAEGVDIAMKGWPCLCLGLEQVSIESSNPALVDGNIETYYCTGLNLSCSEFALKNFYGGKTQKPISCEKAKK